VDLAGLAIARQDVPFAVLLEQGSLISQENMSSPISSSPFDGALEAYSQMYSGQVTDPATASYLMQLIIEYPTGSTSKALDAIETQFREDTHISPKIWLENPDVGEESFALTGVQGSNSNTNPSTMIVFRKANIIEVIMLSTRNPDFGVLKKVAATAAAKIPAGGTNPRVVPTTASPAPTASSSHVGVSSVSPADVPFVFAGPVMIAPAGRNSIGKVTFTIKLNDNAKAIDMSRTDFMVMAKTIWTGRYGDPAVRMNFAGGNTGTTLSPGEIVTVELDTGGLDVTSSQPGTPNRVSFDIKPPVGAGAGKTCILPSTLTPGSAIQCP